MQIIAARSAQPRRITLSTSATPSTTATDYAVERADGGYSPIGVSLAWLVGAKSVELALSNPLLEGITYTVSIPSDVDAPSFNLVYYGQADPAPIAPANDEDPAAEAYGVSIDWLSGGLTGGGDLVEVRGRQCLLDDLMSIAVMEPGELFHRPDDGGSLPQNVNGPATPQQLGQIRSRLKRQWAKDSRVKSVDSVDFVVDQGGQIQMRSKITESVTGEQIMANVPGSNG